MPRHYSKAHEVVKSLKASADAKRTWSERFADLATKFFGSVFFLLFNAFCFLAWIVVNMDAFPGIEPFDPFPFGLLTMIVSLEAIFLSIFVLISQNRTEKVDELRDEIDLQVDVRAEHELTKMLQLQFLLLKKSGIDVSNDRELKEMLKPEDTEKLERDIEKQI